mgnify:CR=1 FL=1
MGTAAGVKSGSAMKRKTNDAPRRSATLLATVSATVLRRFPKPRSQRLATVRTRCDRHVAGWVMGTSSKPGDHKNVAGPGVSVEAPGTQPNHALPPKPRFSGVGA